MELILHAHLAAMFKHGLIPPQQFEAISVRPPKKLFYSSTVLIGENFNNFVYYETV